MDIPCILRDDSYHAMGGRESCFMLCCVTLNSTYASCSRTGCYVCVCIYVRAYVSTYAISFYAVYVCTYVSICVYVRTYVSTYALSFYAVDLV